MKSKLIKTMKKYKNNKMNSKLINKIFKNNQII